MTAEETIERLMKEHADAVLRMCYLYLKDYHLAEDAAQETFIKAMKSYEGFDGRSSEKTWLIRIAVNCCKNIMRTQWFRIGRGSLEEDVREPGFDPAERMLETDSMTRAIQRLGADDREVLVLYYYQELSMKEIAQVIRKSENTAIQRVNRARIRLKKILMEAGYGA